MTVTHQRKSDRTAAAILNAALRVSCKTGYLNMTSEAVANAAGVSKQCVSHYYGADELRAAVCRSAIEHEVLPIIAEAVIGRCPHIAACPVDLRQAAMRWSLEQHQ